MMAKNFLRRAFIMMAGRRSNGRTGYTGPIIVRTPQHAILKKGNPIPFRLVSKLIYDREFKDEV